MLCAELVGTGPMGLEVSAAVGPGSCLALAGPSGSGKTTALRALAGLVRPRHGRVTCGEGVWLDTKAGVDVPPERRSVGMVFQHHALFGHLDAWRNVAYGIRALPRAERRRRALAALDRFGLSERAGARPSELSGGERQRVALARALAREPAVLLLDEPLASLDARTRAAATALLSATLRESGIPTVLVTHDFAEAAQLADEIAVLDTGRIVQRGTAGELAAAPASGFVADFSGAVVLLGTAEGTRIRLDGGGELLTTTVAHGPVAATLHPWEIALERPGPQATGSASNRLAGRITTVTALGSRTRIGLHAAQPLVAEVTPESVERLRLCPGAEVTAVFKAAALRVVAR